MANQPTIVVANLDDAKLKASIDKMVNDLNAGLNKMTANTDAAVAKMQALLQSVGNIKFGSGGSDGGSSKRTKKQQEEADAVKQTAKAYDQLAQTQQKSTQVKSARESYYAFVQGYKEQANGIASLIRDFENALTKTIQNRVAEINSQIATSKDKIRALNEELNRRQFAVGNPEAQAQVRRELDKELRTVRELEGQLANVNQQFAFEKTYLASLYGEHYRISNIMREEGEIQRQRVSTENQITAELNKQMQKVFEIDSRKKASAAFQSISGMDSSTLDRAEAKLKALEALKEKVRNTDMFSAKNMQNLEAMISYQKSIVEKHKNAGFGVTKDDEEAIKKAAAAEEQWTEKIKARGQVAQETSRKMLRMLNEEAQAGGKGLMGMYTIDGKEISAVKELSVAIKDMQNAYNKMSDSEKESAIGRALKKDIETTKEAIRVVSAYNAMALGMNRGGVGNQQQQLNIERLRQIIKQLTEDFSKLSIEDVKAGRGNLLIDRIQRTSRALQQLQAQMNRPTSLDKALKLPANTLDEIAYKMQMLSNYRANLNIFDPKQKEEIDAVNKALEKLRLEQSKIMGQNKEMLASNNALVRSFNYMKNRLAFYFTVGASTQFIKQLIDIRSQYEMNERALGILINSAERGSQIFSELSQMALISPYTLIELSAAAKQLVAYDIAAKDVVDTTRRLADMASAVGVPMERLTYALGQIKAYGYLNSRDARMFANAGIPLVKQLSDYYTQLEGKIVSTADVYDRMKKKAIDYNDVMAVVTKMTDEGGKFFDFQAKMAETLKVRLANLTLAWNNMLNEIGENQQGILTSTIGALKELFLHWKDISNVMNTLLVAFGSWKTAQAIGLLYIGELNTAMGAQVLLGQKLGKTLTSAAASTKSFITASGVAATAFLYVIADAFMTWQRNSEEIQKFNSSIADGAKEASEALYNMLHSSEMVDARLNAINGKLSSSDASKAWERIREQLELSALTSKDLIAQLMLEPDLNKRVAESFNLAERIESATNKLVDLNTQLKVTQDSFLYGLFGEGIAEDINDFTNRLETAAETEKIYIQSTGSVVEDAYIAFKGFFSDMKEKLGDSREEAEREIKNFAVNAADIIKDELGEEGLKDKIQVNEAIARVIRGFEQQFPNIRGKGKALFETMFNDIMAEEFGKSFDKQAYYYNKFLDQLKKDHASAFGDVTDDILKDTHKWTSAQKDAIEKTAEKVKKDLPEASQSAIDEILRQLNSTEFKVRIVAEMATTSLDKVQQQFKDKYINKPWVADDKEREKQEAAAQQKYGTLMRKNTETNVEYEKRISDERKKQLELSQKNADIIEKNKNKQDAYSKAVLADAQAQKSAADDWLATAEEIENAGGYDFRTKQETKKTKGNKKDLVLEALKQEIQLVEKLQSDYDKLAKSGASQSDALAAIRGAYGNTIKKLNTELGGYGLPTIDITELIVGKDPNRSLEHFKNTLSSLIDKGMLTLERSKEVEAVIEKLTLSAKTYNLDMITKGLKNELGKVKDEYELALELDANPELGDMFAEMFGIDTSELPHTFGQALARVQESVNKALRGINVDDSFDILNGDIKAFASTTKLALEGDVVKSMEKAQKYVRDLWKKNTEETIKNWNTLLEKYGDYQTKLIKAVQDTAKEQLDIVRKFGNSEEQAEAINLSKKITVASDLDDVNRIQEQLKVLVDKVVKGKDVGIKLAASVEKSNAKTRAKIEWDTFKDSDYYAIMFEDMDRVSTRAIRSILEQLDVLKAKVKEDPASMKALMDAYKKGRDELESRAPFENIITSLKEWRAASIEVKDANVKLTEANKELESAQANLANAQAAAATPNSRFSNDAEKAERLAKAQERYTKAVKNRQTAEAKVAQAEIRQISAQTKFQNALNGSATALQNVGGLLTQFAELLGITEDSEAGEMVKSLAQGFNLMATALTLVAAAAALAQMSLGWVAAVAAGLSVVVGLVSFLAGSSNRKITAQIEEIERDVHGLEIAYKNLEQAADDAYGAMVSGAKAALIANKQAQLDDLERQYELAKSRTGKHYDQDEVDKYHDAIVDLRNEIHELTQDITNELLDISSAGDGITSLVEVMIDAFKNGEDAMEAFGKKWDEMIDNMILKLIVSTFMQKAWDDVMRTLKDKEAEFMQKAADERAEAQKQYDQVRDMSDDEVAKMIANQLGYEGLLSGKKDEVKNAMQRGSLHSRGNANSGYYFYIDAWQQVTDEEIAAFRKMLESAVNNTEGSIDKASTEYTQWALDYMSGEGRDYMTNYAEMLKAALGDWYTYGQDSQKNLSALQQGIQGITEDTAGAIEAYMNGVSQQVYLHSDLLTQIRDIIVGFDLDIHLDTLGQILLQLRSSYEIQSAIHSLLSGWSSDNERAVRVELLS